jgi:hypothetical protein
MEMGLLMFLTSIDEFVSDSNFERILISVKKTL